MRAERTYLLSTMYKVATPDVITVVCLHLGQLAAPDVVDLGQLLDVALPPLALPVDEEPILVHPDTAKIISL